MRLRSKLGTGTVVCVSLPRQVRETERKEEEKRETEVSVAA